MKRERRGRDLRGLEGREMKRGRGLSGYFGSCACAAAGKPVGREYRMTEGARSTAENRSMFGVVCAHVL